MPVTIEFAKMNITPRVAAMLVLLLTSLIVTFSCTPLSDSSGAEPTPLPPGVEYRTITYPTPAVRSDGSQTHFAAEVERNGQPPGSQRLELVGGTQAPSTLDPAVLRDASSSFLARQIFRGLTRLDGDLNPYPDLAERIDISADGLEYTFHLRPGAVFHNGEAITAEAVADSLVRAANPDLAGGDGFSLPAAIYLIDIEGARERLSGEAETISGIEVVGEHQLRITLVERSQTFLSKLAGSPALVVDVDSISGEGWWRNPNGSGPFRVQSFNPDSGLELQAFDEFWGGRPLLDSVQVRYGSDAVQPLNLYESGTIDVTSFPQYAIDRVASETSYLNAQLVVQPQLATTFVALSPDAEPFDDPSVRQALGHLLNREKIVDVTFQDRVRLARGLVPPGILGREWRSEVPEFDPEAARHALEGADISRPPQLVDPGSGIAVILKQVAEEELDLSIEVIAQDWPEFSSRLTEGTLPAFVLTWIADYADPENFLEALFHTDSPDNYLGYSNQEVDSLLDRAAAATDQAERERLYLAAQQRIIDDGVLIPVYHEVDYTLVKPYVRDLTITPVGILALDAVWIENDERD